MVTISYRNRFTDHYLVRKIRAILESAPAAQDPLVAHHRVLNLLIDSLEHVSTLSLLRFRGDRIETLARQGRRPLEPILRINGWTAGTTRARRQAVYVPDSRAPDAPRGCHPNVRSEIGVPVWLGERVRGELHADSDFENAFPPEDLHLLADVAGEIGGFWRAIRRGTAAAASA